MKDLIAQIAIDLIMTYLLFRIRHFILTVGKHEKKYDGEGGSLTPPRASVEMNPDQAQPVELEAGVVCRSGRVENGLRERRSGS